jgi:hypothetical protein
MNPYLATLLALFADCLLGASRPAGLRRVGSDSAEDHTDWDEAIFVLCWLLYADGPWGPHLAR